MAVLKDSLITGDLRVTGTIYGDVPLNDLVDADDLKAIEALSGTSGLLKKTGANTWTLDTAAYTTSSGVTSVRVQATSPVVSSVNTAQTSTLNTTISLADGYGDTKNPYASKTARYVLAAPASANGAPTFRALTNADVGLGNVENTKLSTWAGSTNITTLGTITTGTVPWANISGKPSQATAWPNWNQIQQNGAESINEGTSDLTDNTEIFTSYASNNGFADTNAKGVVYRRDAIHLYNYIKGKTDALYAPKSHVHGNLTNDGKVGTIADRAVYTGTGGAITAGTLPVAAGGTGAESFVADAILTGNDSNAINSSSTYVRGEMLETGRYFHNVAQYYTTATPKEILIKTKIKFSNGSRMPKIIIHMYNYADNNPTELSLGFYIYGDAFTNYGATSNTATRPVITLSTYTENENKYVAIGLGLIGTAIYPNGYYTRFNIDVLDIWSGSTAKTAALEGWVITDNTTTSTIIPTTDRKVVDYKDQSNSTIGFASAKSIALTGNVTGSATGGNGSNGWSIATTIGSGVVTNAMLAGSIANGKLVNSKVTIAGNDVSLGGSLAAATLKTSLGLNSAMHYIGKATVAITDGSTTDPKIGGNATTLVSGDVVIDNSDSREYVWNGSKWELLGGDSSYKVTQTAVTDAAYSGSDTATTFVSAVTQNANGEITVTKRKLPTYNNYSHPTGDGNKHVPANGTSNNGKFLQATATAGTYQWASLPTASTTGAGIIQIGTAATNAAAGNHTHTTSLSQTGTATINLAANTAYTLTAGGTSVVFKTPADTTYTFDGTYNASSNKAATVSTVTNAINALDGNLNSTTPGAGKTLTAFSQTDGKVSATFGNISITKSQISDFPTTMTPASHTHGKITNDGKIASTDNVAIANNDRLVISDASDSYILKNTSIVFDGSTATKALTQKGTWETFNNYSLPLAASGTRGGIKIGYSSSGKNYAVQLSSEKAYVNVPWTDTQQNITLKTTTKGYITAVETAPTGTAAAQAGIADTGVYLTTTAGQINATSYKINEKSYISYDTTVDAIGFTFV